jgi:inner membrane protein
MALLAWSPVGSGLFLVGFEGAAIVGCASVLILTKLPDFDTRIPLVQHRGGTHTLLFALVVGLVLGGGFFALASGVGATRAIGAGGFGFLVGTHAIGSHLLADALTPSGVAVLWPVSDRRYSVGLVRADSRLGNHTLLVLGVLATWVGFAVIAGLDPRAVG